VSTKQRTPVASASSRSWVIGGIVAVLVIGFVAALAMSAGDGDGDREPAAGATQETAPVSIEGTALPAFPGNGEADLAVGEPAPRVEGESFDEQAVSVGGATGRPQMLVFLSHACPHCQAEVPVIVDAAAAGAFDGVDVVGVATNTSETLANYPPSAWLAREEWPFPVLADDEELSTGNAYGLTAFPYFVFVDAEGDVVGRLTGELDEEVLASIGAALRSGTGLSLPGGDGGSTNAN
jgi:cytochrome c biogenesis protein CcmG, thiol:disulfide interchange protein DsbE